MRTNDPNEPRRENHGGEPKPAPAVPVARSVAPDVIDCLEDGRPLRALTRYLRATYALTPAQYRARWGLPEDYPMVAPNTR